MVSGNAQRPATRFGIATGIGIGIRMIGMWSGIGTGMGRGLGFGFGVTMFAGASKTLAMQPILRCTGCEYSPASLSGQIHNCPCIMIYDKGTCVI